MTTITIERAVLLRALEALRPATAPNGAKRDAAFEELRAALSAPATAPDLSAAYIGAREDLAVWKKRALEAEETARQLNRALAEEVNGPTFMGEPVLPATTPEKTVKEIMEFVRHYAADTFSSATLEDKIRRSLAAPATAPDEQVRRDAERVAWYENNPEKVLNIGFRWYSRNGYGLPMKRRKGFREAIDAAMKETP